MSMSFTVHTRTTRTPQKPMTSEKVMGEPGQVISGNVFKAFYLAACTGLISKPNVICFSDNLYASSSFGPQELDPIPDTL